MSTDTVSITFDFPKDEYHYLELYCRVHETTIPVLARDLIIRAMEDYEDSVLAKQAEEILQNLKEEDLISHEELGVALGLSGKEETNPS